MSVVLTIGAGCVTLLPRGDAHIKHITTMCARRDVACEACGGGRCVGRAIIELMGL